MSVLASRNRTELRNADCLNTHIHTWCTSSIRSSVSRKHASVPAPVPSSVSRKPKSWKALARKVPPISAAHAKELFKGHVYLSPSEQSHLLWKDAVLKGKNHSTP